MHDSNSKPYIGSTTKLVVAFDIGTTFTGISYCILEPGRVPKVHGVTKFPGQGQAQGDSKVPSLLYYDKSGDFKEAGADAVSENTNVIALSEGWIMAKWWKLHLRPNHMASSLNLEKLPPLPPGKSALDILTDFTKYLFKCTKTYIMEHHLGFTWPTVEDSIEYIFTHPNGWEGFQQQQYRQAIVCAGLVPNTPQGQARIHMLTEGEASLHFCVPILLGVKTADDIPRGVVIIDAGGGTIDLSMYSMTVNPVSCKEVAPAECRLQGSAFVTCRATSLLREKFAGWEHFSEENIAECSREFDKSTKLVIKSDQEPAYLRVANPRYNNSKYNIGFGRLRLTGAEATGLFKPSYDAIIDAFEKQVKSTTTPITTAFFVGGLSTNDWLWSRLKLYFEGKHIEIRRPDDHVNKAVANGAVLSCVDRENHLVTARVARVTYGVPCSVYADRTDQQHIKRKDKWHTNPMGHYVPGYFETKLLRGTQVNKEVEFRESFSRAEYSLKDFGMETVRLVAYRGELSGPEWIDQDEASFSTLCTISADLREATQDLVMKRVVGRDYYKLDYDVAILFGLSELQAYFGWKTKGGKRNIVPGKITYYEPETLKVLYAQG